MKRILLTLTAASLTLLCAHAIVPRQMVIPNIPGYVTLKGDFHVHTTFSDGTVWPTTRVDESLMDGHDFICITDHVDKRLLKNRNSGLYQCDRNTSFKIAQKQGKSNGVLVIHGSEISHGMPPGHFNTHFITDSEIIGQLADSKTDPYEGMLLGLKEAKKQGAFLVWNHPHWCKQAPNETKWYDEQTKILQAGLMDGIEIFNQFDGYSSEAHHWAIQHHLAILSGTDCHHPLFTVFDYEHGQLRPTTLVFAREKTIPAIREALNQRRTAVFAEGKVYGYEETLSPLSDAVLQVASAKMTEKKASVTLKNTSSIPLYLTKAPGSEEFIYTRYIYIPPFGTYNTTYSYIDGSKTLSKKEFDMHFTIENFFIDAKTPLKHTVHVVCK